MSASDPVHLFWRCAPCGADLSRLPEGEGEARMTEDPGATTCPDCKLALLRDMPVRLMREEGPGTRRLRAALAALERDYEARANPLAAFLELASALDESLPGMAFSVQRGKFTPLQAKAWLLFAGGVVGGVMQLSATSGEARPFTALVRLIEQVCFSTYGRGSDSN